MPLKNQPFRVDLPEGYDLSFVPQEWIESLATSAEIDHAITAGVLFSESGSTPGCIKFDQGTRRHFVVMTDDQLSEWAQEAECDSRVDRMTDDSDCQVTTVLWGIRKATERLRSSRPVSMEIDADPVDDVGGTRESSAIDEARTLMWRGKTGLTYESFSGDRSAFFQAVKAEAEA